jgi:AcrR family transcriptional regulator
MADWNGAVASRSELRQQKMRAVLRVASRIFNEKGYHGASLDEIAEEVGVTKAALYYYFKNKEQLLFECMMISYNCGQQARLESIEMGGKAFDRLVHLYKRFAELLMTERGAFTSKANLHALPEEFRSQLWERRRTLDRYSRGLLKEAIDEGSIREVDVRIASNYYLGAVNWILRWYTGEEDRTPAEIAEAFVDLMVFGVGKTDAPCDKA